MPVKNKNRHTNSVLEGIITGLTEEEKEILEKVLNITDVIKNMPTDINVDNEARLILEHDGKEITGQKKLVEFKTIFGNQSLLGEGNIDLYRHFLTLTTVNATYYLNYWSSNNLKCNSLQDLTTITKAVEGTKIAISNIYLTYNSNVWKLSNDEVITTVKDDVTTI